jgi:hypothetical protein
MQNISMIMHWFVTLFRDHLDAKDEIGLDPTVNLRTDEQGDKVNNTVFCTVMPCTSERARRFRGT